MLIASAAAAVLLTCRAPPPATAQVQSYRFNDYGGFRDVLPPGTNGRSNLVELRGVSRRRRATAA